MSNFKVFLCCLIFFPVLTYSQEIIPDADILDMFGDMIEEVDSPLWDNIDDPELLVEVISIELNIHEDFDSEWIESFLLFHEGMSLPLGELNELIEETIFRLKRNDDFYHVNIFLKPSLEDISKRTVIVEVSEGFPYAFNFYPVNFYLAFRHLFRSNKHLGITAGTNEQSLEYIDPAILYSPFFYSLKLGHTTLIEENDRYIEDKIAFGLGGGINLNYEISLGFSTDVLLYHFPENYFYYGDWTTSLSPRASEDFGVDGDSAYLFFGIDNFYDYNRTKYDRVLGMENLIHVRYVTSIYGADQNFYEFQNRLKLFFRPLSFLNIVLRNFVGYHTETTYPYLQYNLYYYENFRGIPEKDYGDTIATFNFDISLENLMTSRMGIFDFDYRPFLYFDMGKLYDYPVEYNLNDIEKAFGGGVHIFVKPPVGLFFTLCLKQRISGDGVKTEFLFEVTDNVY